MRFFLFLFIPLLSLGQNDTTAKGDFGPQPIARTHVSCYESWVYRVYNDTDRTENEFLDRCDSTYYKRILIYQDGKCSDIMVTSYDYSDTLSHSIFVHDKNSYEQFALQNGDSILSTSRRKTWRKEVFIDHPNNFKQVFFTLRKKVRLEYQYYNDGSIYSIRKYRTKDGIETLVRYKGYF